tara:strand:- start:1167 stop:1325 length:159 start_codon:yes stop_codon:yes gene_type:complete
MTIRNIWHELPDLISLKLMKFLEESKTGQVTLNIKDGKVKAIDIRETVRVSS